MSQPRRHAITSGKEITSVYKMPDGLSCRIDLMKKNYLMQVDDARASCLAILARQPTLVQRTNPIAKAEIGPTATDDQVSGRHWPSPRPSRGTGVPPVGFTGSAR